MTRCENSGENGTGSAYNARPQVDVSQVAERWFTHEECYLQAYSSNKQP